MTARLGALSLTVIAFTIAACDQKHEAATPPPPQIGRYVIVPAGREIAEDKNSELAFAWRIDTVTGETAYCSFFSGTGDGKLGEYLDCTAKDDPSK